MENIPVFFIYYLYNLTYEIWTQVSQAEGPTELSGQQNLEIVCIPSELFKDSKEKMAFK